jgi:hypothetical protein
VDRAIDLNRPGGGSANRPRERWLFSDNHNENLSLMRRATMFEKENALPGAELHFTIDNRDGLASARQDHANV